MTPNPIPPPPSWRAWLARPGLALALPLIWMGVIFWESSKTSNEIPSFSIPHLDKVIHAGIYGILGLLLFHAVGRLRPPWSYRTALIATIIASLYGITDEVHQMSVAGRTAEVADWVADTLGACISFFSAYLVNRTNRDPNA